MMITFNKLFTVAFNLCTKHNISNLIIMFYVVLLFLGAFVFITYTPEQKHSNTVYTKQYIKQPFVKLQH